MMPTDKDVEQDALIRRNAESIRRNEAAILRQTEALEKIRDHYFPKKTLWKQACGFFLKVVGAVTIAAGILESADWYWNTRLTDRMAGQSAAAARRMLFRENDIAGAAKFLEKAVELDDGTIRYRIALAYVKGLEVLSDLFDVGRPLTGDERRRVDGILAEAVFLQEVAPDEPMPYVLAAQAYALRDECAAAARAADRAVALAPENAQARVTACVTRYRAGNVAEARRLLGEAERIDPGFPTVLYWKAFLAAECGRDGKAALALVDELLRRVPRLAHAHGLRAWILMREPSPDFAAVRAALTQTLEIEPALTDAMVLMAETYEREGNPPLAKLWLDRALRQDALCLKARVARARLAAQAADWKAACDDLTAAIDLSPLRADLYRERAAARKASGDAAGAAADAELAAALVREAAQPKRN